MEKKNTARQRRHRKILKKWAGRTDRLRLIVYRSLQSTYAQMLDDKAHKTLFTVSDLKIKKGTKCEKAKEVGKQAAQKAGEINISTCIFDRNGYKYHGRVKAVAEGAREGGLKL